MLYASGDAEDTFPPLLAGQCRNGVRYCFLSSGKRAASSRRNRDRFLEQLECQLGVALAVDDAATVGGGDGDAVDLREQEPAGVEGRHVELRTLVMLGLAGLTLCTTPLTRRGRSWRRVASAGSRPRRRHRRAAAVASTTAARRRRGTPCAGRGPRRVRWAACSRRARVRRGSPAIALFWIATVEYSRHSRCLSVALTVLTTRPRPLPGMCSAATTSRLRRWKYACQSMASSLSLHAMCQIAAPGIVTVG